jgi:hypothetical protein
MSTYVDPIERIIGSFSDNPVYDALAHRLAEIAATWRSTHANDLVVRYNVVLRCLVELGYTGPVDSEIRLPKQFMSLEYRNHQWRERILTPEAVKE